MVARAERWPDWSAPGTREADEIARILAFRADRALAQFERLARRGPAFTCPICGYVGPFAPKGHKPSVWCPQCDSRPRHRLLRLWMGREMGPVEGARVLHFAAEPWVRARLVAARAVYASADLIPGFDLVRDITRMEDPDASWDMVIANHVLEHVDDRAALAELRRVLVPGGRAVLSVPLVEGWDATYEGAYLDAETRSRRLVDPDHRRFYGRDFRDRLRDAGFEISEVAAVEPDVSTHALQRGERIFIARTPEARPCSD
ncbi:MAG: methyltransferase domain-containing protein [Paracoccaceae bacterium]